MSLSRGSPAVESYTYNANLQLESVKSDGRDDWIYTYDVNGNIVSIKMAETKVTLGLDGGDRVVMYGDLELVSYDDRGFVVRRGEQRYSYNAFGQMIIYPDMDIYSEKTGVNI